MLSIRRKFEGKRIFCAIDRLESLKIVPLKYWLERFLKRCPEWIGKVVLIQVGIQAFERGDDYTWTENEVRLWYKNKQHLAGTIEFPGNESRRCDYSSRIALLSYRRYLSDTDSGRS
jgi:trehalose 6-phosphate synthase/phosphatase